MSFAEKIDALLRTNKLGVSTMEDLSLKVGFSRDTIRKAVERGSSLNKSNTQIFLDKLGINPRWWESGDGDIFNGEGINTSQLSDAIRAIVEDGTEYLVVPKIVLEGKYRLVPIEQIEREKHDAETRSQQIQGLYDLIKDITARPVNIHLANPEKT